MTKAFFFFFVKNRVSFAQAGVLKSWPEAILWPQPPKVMGVQV